MGIQPVTKEQIIYTLDELPPESLREVQQYLDFLRFKIRKQADEPAVAIGGLLEGYSFTDEDIAQARREMWERVDGSTQ
ncbi:MAG: hypothetical protein KKC18_06230 [Chloroflexi bacterium]|nr:hypothetical protein [Chloroflexota bacterium]